MRHRPSFLPTLVASLLLAAPALGSSHREAPGILSSPQVDGTDFYMFRSYEEGRDGFVTLIANYNPLQDPFGGPNYFPLDPAALYDIHVDNDGDARENVTFTVKPSVVNRGLSLPVGPPGQQIDVEVPVMNIGPVFFDDDGNLNQNRSVKIAVVVDGRSRYARNVGTGDEHFAVPFDNIGEKTFPDYETYASQHVHEAFFPGCGNGRVFVGQRTDPFAVNLGEIFDLVNLAPLFPTDDEESDLVEKNITSIALEVPIDCLTGGGESVIGGWTTARLPRGEAPSGGVIRLGGPRVRVRPQQTYEQVSRVANPLVNELVVGVSDKDAFNAGHPTHDARFLHYVTHPVLPELLEILFGELDGLEAPNNFPRHDLVAVFLTGIAGVNQNGSTGDLLRLDTATLPTETFDQDPMGLLGGDPAGFPNGRRPGDDVVDISLRAVMGVLCHEGLGLCGPEDAPSGAEELTDGAFLESGFFDEAFPYLTTPVPGSPNGEGTT